VLKTVMAAASSGVVVVVVEDGDGSGKESHEGKQGVLVGELPDSFSLENGETPQEGTKEHMNVVERHLDELTFCGSTINDLELQLSSVRASFRKTLGECKLRLEETRKRLGSCIPKSQPFIEVWRKARQVQEESNKAAARFDKASSQYAAAKEMIRVTEGELANSLPGTSEEGRAIDESVTHALLEVLNHATKKVVGTEKEKRESEAEHRRVLDRCNAVLEEYRLIERKLRPHIIKSRPYFEERWRSSQELNVRPHVTQSCVMCAVPQCIGTEEAHLWSGKGTAENKDEICRDSEEPRPSEPLPAQAAACQQCQPHSPAVLRGGWSQQ
jgi:hypothetical protein